ncbi:MAG: thioredoxin [Cytophagaceae bacterium]|jgi:thioredoxin 1|nr:thioredoxin [Cytophagaceae bacterium]
MKGNLNELIQSKTPILIDFYADWCGPCKALAPELQKVADRMDDAVRIVKINVDKNPAAAQTFQVRGVPTLLLFQQGKLLWRNSGFISEKQLTQTLQSKLKP